MLIANLSRRRWKINVGGTLTGGATSGTPCGVGKGEGGERGEGGGREEMERERER